MRQVCLMILILLAGCAGMDPASRHSLDTARSAVDSDVTLALREARAVLERHPENLEARALAARALSSLDRYVESAHEWTFVVENDDASYEDLITSHRGRLNTLKMLLGPPPHEPDANRSPTDRDWMRAGLESCEFIIDEEGADEATRLAQADLLYRLGMSHKAQPILSEVLQDSPQQELAQYLQTLVQEQQSGVDEVTIRSHCRLVRAQDAEVRRLAATHLIYLLDGQERPELVKDNIRGNLLRFAREDAGEVPVEIAQWAREHQEIAADKIDSRRLARQLSEIDGAEKRREWNRGWRLLGQLPASDAQVQARRRSFIDAWCLELVQVGEQLIEQGDLEGARKQADTLAQLPRGELPDASSTLAQEFEGRLKTAETRSSLSGDLKRIEEALQRRDFTEAFAILETMSDTGLPTELKRQILAFRAEALYQSGDHKSALQILDELQDPSTPRHQRIYGILLAKMGRGEEAQSILENLPLGHLAGDALSAYFEALRQQKNWDAILARMLAMRPLPEEYRPVRRDACFEAASIRLRRRNPRGALKMLETHLPGDELGMAPVHEVYLQSVLAVGQVESAQELIQLQGVDALPPVSDRLARKLAEEVAPLFPESESFQLLKNLESNSPGTVRDQLMALWSRFGDYFPKPGNYTAQVRSYDVDGDGGPAEAKSFTQNMNWIDGGFEVKCDDMPNERWTISDGIWTQITPGGDRRIPVRVTGPPPYEPTTFIQGSQQWTAEIMETNARVEINSVEYLGCLRIRLTPGDSSGHSTILTIAPEVGEIRREELTDRRVRFIREIVNLSANE